MMYHTTPWECVFAKEEKSSCKPGKKLENDNEYFEVLALTVLQAGLNWKMVREKWEGLCPLFKNFNVKDVAKLNSKNLLNNPKMIKNENKIKAIIMNAHVFLKIAKEYGSFKNYLKGLEKLSQKEKLKKLEENFHRIGKYSAEYFLHSVGEHV
jgi:3-methyladenine DNA glycosylase Tag